MDLSGQASRRLTIGLFAPGCTSAIMIVWIAALLGTLKLEYKRDGVAKWLVVLVCLGFGAIIVVADSPNEIVDHRPHVTTVMTGIVVFSFAYAIQSLTQRYTIFTWPAMKIMAAGLIIFMTFGAQSNVYRGIVLNRASMINFMRAELSSKPPHSFDIVIVIISQNKGNCSVEPCGPWFGPMIQSQWHMTRPAAYNYAMATAGINPNGKTIIFTDSFPDSTDGSVVVDWRKYIRSRK